MLSSSALRPSTAHEAVTTSILRYRRRVACFCAPQRPHNTSSFDLVPHNTTSSALPVRGLEERVRVVTQPERSEQGTEREEREREDAKAAKLHRWPVCGSAGRQVPDELQPCHGRALPRGARFGRPGRR